ncbi:MAG: tetratricopeptide repeat protein, partial [Kofleriaceae bacterium]
PAFTPPTPVATTTTAPTPVATATTAPSPVATATTAPSPVATTTTALRRHRRAIAIAVGCLVIGAAATAGIIALVERPADPWRAESKAQEVAARPAMDDRDRQLFHDFVGLFGVLAERTQPGASNGGPSTLSGSPPTTARGWLELSERQPPVEAIASLRQALALSPGWPEAENALCIALSNAEDDGAVPVCDAALRRQPYTIALLAARATAQLRAGQPASAIADLDRVIAGDPAPKWRRLRAQARTAAGDQEGARRDLEQACQLGDAPSCRAP